MTESNDEAKTDVVPKTQAKTSGGFWRLVRNSAIGAGIAYLALIFFVPRTLPACDSSKAASEMISAYNQGPYSIRTGVKALRVVEAEEISFNSERQFRACRAVISRSDAVDRAYRVEMIMIDESAMEITLERW